MQAIKARVATLHVGVEHGVMEDRESIEMRLDGVEGDRYQSFSRRAGKVDKQPEGTERRNERQWSASSVEELEAISADMDLAKTLTGNSVSVNIVFEGIPELSRLPKGTLLRFPSGAELVVVEYNPPCKDQGERIAARHTTRSGRALQATTFPKAAALRRGVVGVVDVAGTIAVGDKVTVDVYETPTWLQRSRVAGR